MRFQMSGPGNSDVSGTRSKTWMSHLRVRDLNLNFELCGYHPPMPYFICEVEAIIVSLHAGVEG